MVPNGWELSLLGEHVNISSGYSPSKYNLNTSGSYPFVKVEDMNNCSKYQQLSREYTELNGNPIVKGSVIFPKRGAAIMNNKVRIAASNMYLDTNMMSLTPKESVCTEFLYYTLVREELHKIADTSTIPQINNKHILPYKFKLPPLSEQQKIAKILSTWDKAIATTEKLIATSQQQKKALMQQLLTGKKRLLNPETGKTFEGDWEHVSLSKLVKVTGGNAFKSEQFQAMGIPLIKISNIKPNYSVTIDSSVFISEDIKYQKFKVIKGDILIAMSGATTGKVGCYQFDEFSYLNQRVGRFDPKKGKIIKSYLFQLLKLPKVQHDILIDAVGGAQPNISNKDIERLKVIVPTANEQQKIASVLTAADKEIELLQAKLAHLKDEKKALMQQLLTGKRRVSLSS